MPLPHHAHRLPRGRHGIAAEQVAANQRWRLLGAAAEILAERGIGGTTSRAIARRASVSSSTFYAHFEDVEDALLASFRAGTDSVREVVVTACDDQTQAEAKLAAAVEAAIALAVAAPAIAALMRLGLAIAVPAVGRGREELIESLGSLMPLEGDLVAATLASVLDRLEVERDPRPLADELSALLAPRTAT